jgi:hypothetical protein
MNVDEATTVLALATVALGVATALLVVVGIMQWRQLRSTDLEARRQTKMFDRQAKAIEASLEQNERILKAQLEVVEEMRAERRERDPLGVRIDLDRSVVGGIFKGGVTNGRDDVVVLIESVWLDYGNPDNPRKQVLARYLLGAGESFWFTEGFEWSARGRILTLTVTGHPVGGLEQTLEFRYRIGEQGKLEDLQAVPIDQA